MIFSRGEEVSNTAISEAAGIRCSKLSISKSISRRARTRFKVSSTGSAALSKIPSVLAIVFGTSEGSDKGARSTNHTPSGKVSTISAATWIASRVLPVPPVPVSVSRRDRSSSCLTRDISAVRPIKGVSCTGRFWPGPEAGESAPPSSRIPALFAFATAWVRLPTPSLP